LSARDTLADAFNSYEFPADASAFLLKVWDAIQFLDDIKDKDGPDDVDAGIYNLIVALPSDRFLAANQAVLSGALATAYHKWQAANVVESVRDATQLDKTYMWRAGYYDVIVTVAALCLPRERVDAIAPHILMLYGESRESYLQEFDSA
jgi:hypothetical protein